MNPIIKEARDLYQKSNDSYKRGEIWDKNGGNYRDLINIINNVNTPQEVIDILRDRDMYNITIRSQRKFDLMMEWNKKLCPISRFRMDICITPNLWKMFFYCQSIDQSIRPFEKKLSIVELGGGNGQFAYIAKHILKCKTHIDIDLPESLYMAYVSTRHWFPEAKCLWVTDERDITVEDWDFIFIPVQREGILRGKKFDLFVNTASMGEMSNDNVRHWMNFVQNEIKVDYFFGFNRFLNTVPANPNDNWHRIRKNEHLTSLLFDTKWEVLKWEVEPDFSRCPYEDPRIARYLMIILKRSENPVQWHDDISEMQEQDWWCYRDVGPLATHRDNQLVHDYTKGGTLFRLWDACRNNPDNKELHQMMCVYLRWISKESTMFEEMFYYERKS